MNKLAMFAAATLFAAAPTAAMAEGEESAAWLGVRMQSVEGGLAEALDLKDNAGVLLSQVLPDSPAEKAGLEKGDIVVKVGGERVGSPADLRRAIQGKKPGDVVALSVLRDGKSRTIEATLAEPPDVRMPIRERVREDLRTPLRDRVREHVRDIREMRLGRERGWLGVQTQPLTGDLGDYFGAKEGGALVAEVIEDSPAAKLGLKPGDVITKVDDETVADPEDLRRAVGRFEEPTKVQVTWLRNGRERTGGTELEIREGRGLPERLGLGLGPGHEMFWIPDDEPGMRERVHAFRRQTDESVDKALEELREQVRKLEEQVKKLERKTR